MSKSKSGSRSKPSNNAIINQRSKSSRDLVTLSSDEDNKFEDFLKSYRQNSNKNKKEIGTKEFELNKQDKLVRTISTNELDSKLSAFTLKSSQKSSESSIIILSSSDSDDDENVSEEEIAVPDERNASTTSKTKNLTKSSSSIFASSILTKDLYTESNSKKLSFVESLNQKLDDESQRDTQALSYINNFKEKSVKIDLLNKLFQIFNETIFESKLPRDSLLIWNPKLTSSGGYCKKIIQNKISSIQIHISVKICDSPERLRDTLLHEMCHGAAFIIDGLLKDNHGAEWQKWARLSNTKYKKIPLITKCHSYASEKKFIYRCQNCQYEFHRNRRSVDVNKYACGNCNKGKFEIIENSKLAKKPSTKAVATQKAKEKSAK